MAVKIAFLLISVKLRTIVVEDDLQCCNGWI